MIAYITIGVHVSFKTLTLGWQWRVIKEVESESENLIWDQCEQFIKAV